MSLVRTRRPPDLVAPASGRKSWPATVVLGLLVLLAAGVLIGRATAPQTSPEAVADSGPTRMVEGVPVGYARTQAGAVAAAANYTAVLGDQRNIDPAFGQRAYRVFALSEVSDDLLRRSRDFAARHPEAEGFLADPRLVLRAAPVGYRVERYTPDEAIVAVWAVVIAAGIDELPLETAWGTEQLTLRWVDGDWRVAAIVSSSGPTPPRDGTEPVPAGFGAEVGAFEAFGYLPGDAR